MSLLASNVEIFQLTIMSTTILTNVCFLARGTHFGVTETTVFSLDFRASEYLQWTRTCYGQWQRDYLFPVQMSARILSIEENLDLG